MSAWKLLEDLLVIKASGVVEPFEVRLHSLKHLSDKKDTNYYIDFPSAIALYYDFDEKLYRVIQQVNYKLEVGERTADREVAIGWVRERLKKEGYV